jgi:hypothetical protein
MLLQTRCIGTDLSMEQKSKMVRFKLSKKLPLEWKAPNQKRNHAISRSRAAVSASSGASILKQCSVSEFLAHSESAKGFSGIRSPEVGKLMQRNRS